MPRQDVWDTARQWGKDYGNLVGAGLLFLNSYEAVLELFKKRGNYYSNRQRTTMVGLQATTYWYQMLIFAETSFAQ
ncbi:hypothetical protein ACEPAH_2787 [Sanghuangporus vaninii]